MAETKQTKYWSQNYLDPKCKSLENFRGPLEISKTFIYCYIVLHIYKDERDSHKENS